MTLGRRRLLIALGAGALAAPLEIFAQQQPKIRRIGFLGTATASAFADRVAALTAGLNDLGYVEGRNLIIEWRWAEGNRARLSGLAAELVQLNVELILTSDGLATAAARNATTAIPIVMTQSVDPMDQGFVRSLAKPGGNVTGLSFMWPEAGGKALELLKEIVPKMTRVAVLSAETGLPNVASMDAAAKKLAVKLQLLKPAGADGIDDAFAKMAKARANAVIVRPNPLLFQNRQRIATLAAKYRLPAIYTSPEYTQAGGLMSYGANMADLWRRAATYVDKILKGAKPADLPVEQPTKFELLINLKTAKALGIKVPQSILVRADRVIE